MNPVNAWVGSACSKLKSKIEIEKPNRLTREGQKQEPGIEEESPGIAVFSDAMMRPLLHEIGCVECGGIYKSVCNAMHGQIMFFPRVVLVLEHGRAAVEAISQGICPGDDQGEVERQVSIMGVLDNPTELFRIMKRLEGT